jgi:hypothetical protein
MNNVLKWGLIIVGLYLLYKWWQGQQATTAPAYIPGLTGSVYGGGVINPVSTVGQNGTYQPYSPLPPASTVTASGNPGYIGWPAPQPILGTLPPTSIWRSVYGGSFVNPVARGGPVPANPNPIGILAQPVGPAPFSGLAY